MQHGTERLPPHAMFMPYTANPDLFFKAASSIFHPDVRAFAIDDSLDGLPESLVPTGWGLFKPSKFITFTEVQNLAHQIAFSMNARYLVFAHSDSECIDNMVVPDLLNWMESRPECGIGFTHYDVVSVFRSKAMRDIGPWDETFEWYSSDNDYYQRARMAAWDVVQSPFGDRVKHECSASVRDSRFREMVDRQVAYQRSHYQHKWGGVEGEEKFSTPYGF